MSIEEVTQNLHENSVEENTQNLQVVGEIPRHGNSKFRVTVDSFKGEKFVYLSFMKKIYSQWLIRSLIGFPADSVPELIRLLEKVK